MHRPWRQTCRLERRRTFGEDTIVPAGERKLWSRSMSFSVAAAGTRRRRVSTTLPAGRRTGRRCALIASYLAMILLVTAALAYASPPDPSWISGIYDDHDSDDVVGMVTDATGAADFPATQQFSGNPAGSVPGIAQGRILHRTLHGQTIRGPPIRVILLPTPQRRRQRPVGSCKISLHPAIQDETQADSKRFNPGSCVTQTDSGINARGMVRAD